MAGSNPFTVMTNIFVTEFAEFGGTFRKNSIALARVVRVCVIGAALSCAQTGKSALLILFGFEGRKKKSRDSNRIKYTQ